MTNAVIDPNSFSALATRETVTLDQQAIHMTDHLFRSAHQINASDIHIEPQTNHYRIRMRRDGLLQPITNLSTETSLQVINRLKILSHLDVTERRIPQDGRMPYYLSNKINYDVRINITPTIKGEKITLRLLFTTENTLSLTQLGLSPGQLDSLLHHIHQPQGLLLITGPTGSGKSLTLYSILHYLNSLERNIATVEDPVEMMIAGINQSNIQPNLNLTFEKLLRSILRQDPDVIMIGEIRDHETAKIALQAAQTGHLVLCTLHANHSVEALSRLQRLGFANQTVLESLSLIIAQRLARKLCLSCQGENSPNCADCYEGYHGRIGLFELLPISSSLKTNFLAKKFPLDQMPSLLFSDHLSLHAAFLKKIDEGLTNHAELKRILGHT